MSQVETVALWAGLFASIAGIVLSVVAMVFAIWVNNRATEVNNQMIRSLQKIESSVERVSTDTRELITAGWNKMLGGMTRQGEIDAVDSDASEQISSGLASEVRSELLENSHEEAGPKIERLELALNELQATVAAQLRHRSSSRSEPLDSLIQTIGELPVEAKALLAILIKNGHLERKEYRSAAQHQLLRLPVRALRNSGLLVPLEGFDEDGKTVPVYWLPPGMGRRPLKVASQLVGEVPRDVLDNVNAALDSVGYARLRRTED